MAKQNNNICPVCNSKDVEIFIEIPQIPVYCNILYKSREEALAAKRADMKLGFCSRCGHVYNYAFDPKLMDYTRDYENSLHFSSRFQEYAEALAARLVERYRLYDKDIIEIGCGDGDFLELVCRLGENRCTGFDPSHVPDLDKTGKEKRITFVRDYYSDKYSDYNADLICCRHVLEHIQKPHEFLKTVRDAIGRRTDTVVFCEVPNVLYTLKDLGIWDLIYEHCSYFSPQSLRRAFEETGFAVLGQEEAFQSQFIGIEAKPASENSSIWHDTEGMTVLKGYVDRFEKSYTSKLRHWEEELAEMGERGQTAAIWGAGSKGATFLNNLNEYNRIVQCMVDINPRKQGNFMAGTGHPIVAPNFLPALNPDMIIVMNSIYLDEIGKTVKDIGLDAELVAV